MWVDEGWFHSQYPPQLQDKSDKATFSLSNVTQQINALEQPQGRCALLPNNHQPSQSSTCAAHRWCLEEGGLTVFLRHRWCWLQHLAALFQCLFIVEAKYSKAFRTTDTTQHSFFPVGENCRHLAVILMAYTEWLQGVTFNTPCAVNMDHSGDGL